MLMAYLLQVPASTDGRKRLLKSFSSYQMFKVTLEFLASNDFSSNPIVMTPDAKFLNEPEFSEESFKSNFDFLFIDPTGRINLASGMSKTILDEIQFEAKLCVKLLNDPEEDNFDALFLKKIDQPLARFDNVFRVALLKSIPTTAKPGSTLDYLTSSNLLRNFVPELLKKALSTKCHLVTSTARPKHNWTVNSTPIQDLPSILYLNLILDPQNSLRVVEHGPQTDIASPEEINEFRDLWGPKAELRRFRDGSIRESVVFDCDDGELNSGSGSIEKRSEIVFRIVTYLLERHIPDFKATNETLGTIVGQFGKFLKEHDTFTSLDILADSSEKDQEVKLKLARSVVLNSDSFQPVMDAFEKFSRELRNLESIPLGIINVVPCSPALCYSSIFPPQPIKLHAEDGDDYMDDDNDPHRPIRLNDIIDVNIELESSSSWPDEITAIEQMKAAFLIRIQKGLETEAKLGAVVFNTPKDAYLDVTSNEGFLFRCRIVNEREAILLKRAIAQPSPSPSLNVKYSAHIRRFSHIPEQVSRIHRLCQRHPHLQLTIRLLKRWVATHLLLSPWNIPEQTVELIAASVYLSSPRNGWSIPANSDTGFLRALKILAEWDWSTPFRVEIDRAARENTESSVSFVESTSQTLTANSGLAVISDLGVTWGGDIASARRLVLLSKSAIRCVESSLEPGNAGSLFRLFSTSLAHFDVRFRLNAKLCPRYAQAIAFDPRVFPIPSKPRSQRTQKFKNIPIRRNVSNEDEDGIAKLRRVLLEGFDPVERFIFQIREAFGNLVGVFVDVCGGVVVGLVFDRDVLGLNSEVGLDWKVGLDVPTIPLLEDSSGKKKKNKVRANIPGLVAEIARLGTGLVESVDIKEEWKGQF
ncbi:hypothetical protein HK096_000895 [Nowakowskiella sp. JEL0078]|nr:hypothetical protein HK096_000895 [Nowakowskiella sp. JEL0078]